jgi:leucyl aminopeptidase
MNNTGKTRWAGAGTAAAFLHHFVEDGVKYAHIDIAGYAMGFSSSASGLGTQSVL